MNKYFRETPCRNGHVGYRYKNNNECVQCASNRRDAHRARDPKATLEYNRKSKEKHKEKIVEQNKLYRIKNKEKRAAYKLDYYNNNREKYNIWVAQRRARRYKAAPNWLTKDHKNSISIKYFISSNISEITGIRHHVDHIVPLKGENVCGLHVPWNLRVIPAFDNLSKGNGWFGSTGA